MNKLSGSHKAILPARRHQLLELLTHLFVVLTLFEAVSSFQPSARIFGGYEDEIEHVPWLVSLRYKQHDDHFCGGALISQYWVLTAGHCAVNLKPTDITVRAGHTYKHKGGYTSQVKRIIVHESYTPAPHWDYDFALLELIQKFPLGNTIRPISLADMQDKMDVGQLCLVSGWGVTHENEVAFQQQRLMSALIPLGNKNDCRQMFYPTAITNMMFCAGGQNADSCIGDSGGPVVCAGKAAGLVSWGRGCGRPKLYAVYSNVAMARAWIRQKSGI